MGRAFLQQQQQARTQVGPRQASGHIVVAGQDGLERTTVGGPADRAPWYRQRVHPLGITLLGH